MEMGGVSVRGMLALSFTTIGSIFLNIFGCYIEGQYWPLFVLATYFLALMSQVFFGLFSPRDFSLGTGKGVMTYWGDYFTAFFIASGVGLGIVLWRSGTISVTSLAFTEVSGLMFYGSLYVVSKLFSAPVSYGAPGM